MTKPTKEELDEAGVTIDPLPDPKQPLPDPTNAPPPGPPPPPPPHR